MKYLVTGSAGFIGYHLAKELLARGEHVLGVDNLNDYYNVQLKRDRLKKLTLSANFCFEKQDLADRQAVDLLFQRHEIGAVLHMAAQAGVRYSLKNPHAYVDSNLVAFVNVLEGCRAQQVAHLVYASSSSVYGVNKKAPFSVEDPVDHPISLYAATKKSNELMAHTYSHLYHLPTTGLRFFTVYGPWGRPDMAIYKFTEAIMQGRPIDVYNFGKMRRDFTYIDDIVEGVLRVVEQMPSADVSTDGQSERSRRAAYQLYNIGNHRPVELEYLISILESCLGRPAKKNYLPMQPGDVQETYADIESLRKAVGFSPNTPIEEGVPKFVQWYQQYHEQN